MSSQSQSHSFTTSTYFAPLQDKCSAQSRQSSACSALSKLDLFSSQDWISEYQLSHVDVDPKCVFDSSSPLTSETKTSTSSNASIQSNGNDASTPKTISTTTTTTKTTTTGQPSKTDWASMFLSAVTGNNEADHSLSVSQIQPFRKSMPLPTAATRSMYPRFTSARNSTIATPPQLENNLEKNRTATPPPTTIITSDIPPSMDFSMDMSKSISLSSTLFHASTATSADLYSDLYSSLIKSMDMMGHGDTDDDHDDVDTTFLRTSTCDKNINILIPMETKTVATMEASSIAPNTTLLPTTPTTILPPPTSTTTTAISSAQPVSDQILALTLQEKEKLQQQRDTKVQASLKRKRTRRRRIREPELKIYVVPRDKDVLLGRGGRSNHHLGNIEYRDRVGELREWYRTSEKNAKTDLSQLLVDWVHQEQKGRFLKLDQSSACGDKWYVVTNIVARRKASQGLREHMTKEERDAKKKKENEKINENDNEEKTK